MIFIHANELFILLLYFTHERCAVLAGNGSPAIQYSGLN